eukprot:366239-Chlamydomonas_euryale.AAC.22
MHAYTHAWWKQTCASQIENGFVSFSPKGSAPAAAATNDLPDSTPATAPHTYVGILHHFCARLNPEDCTRSS